MPGPCAIHTLMTVAERTEFSGLDIASLFIHTIREWGSPLSCYSVLGTSFIETYGLDGAFNTTTITVSQDGRRIRWEQVDDCRIPPSTGDSEGGTWSPLDGEVLTNAEVKREMEFCAALTNSKGLLCAALIDGIYRCTASLTVRELPTQEEIDAVVTWLVEEQESLLFAIYDFYKGTATVDEALATYESDVQDHRRRSVDVNGWSSLLGPRPRRSQ